MENIREEDTQPRRRVAEAYAESTATSIAKRNAFWVFAIFAFLLLSNGGGQHPSDKQLKKRAKKLRKQAETIPSIEVRKQQLLNKELEVEEKMQQMKVHDYDNHEGEGEEPLDEDEEDSTTSTSSVDYAAVNTPKGYDDDDDDEAEEELQEEIETAMIQVDEAGVEEIEINDSMLVTAVRNVEDSTKYYLGKLFGFGEDGKKEYEDDDDDDDYESETSADVKLTEEQLDLIAKKISERLEASVNSEFRTKVKDLSEEKWEEIEQVVEEDRDEEMDAHDIAEDVAEAESVLVKDLKEEIDETAEKMKIELPEKAKRIRDEVVEEVTGKKLDRIEEIKRRKRERKKLMLKKFKEMNKKMEDLKAKPPKVMQVSSSEDDDGVSSGADGAVAGASAAPVKKSKTMMDLEKKGGGIYASEDEDE